MKRLLASVLSLLGVACSQQATPAVQTIDPKKLRYSTPTLSEDIPQLEPVGHLSDKELVFHEDEWGQLEFFTKDRLAEIKRMLTEYKAFELANREALGWRDVYVRKIKRAPVIPGETAVHQLQSLLSVAPGPAPVLESGSSSGRVKNGFTFHLGGNVILYGFSDGQSIPVLAAIVGQKPDDSMLTSAFSKLNSSFGLILVDWRAQMLLTSITETGQVEVWRP